MIYPGANTSSAVTAGISPGFTERQIVFFRPAAMPDVIAQLKNDGGITVAASTAGAWTEILEATNPSSLDTVIYPQLGVAVMTADSNQVARISAVAGLGQPILNVRPELIFRIAASPRDRAVSADYLRGYQDGTDRLVDSLLGGVPGTLLVAEGVSEVFRDSTAFTWGLQAIGIPLTTRTGKGVKIAVLDTGYDTTHPDFLGRGIVGRSFVAGAPTVDDDNLGSHGTHTLGTIFGPITPSQGPRYGIAPDAQLFVAKVMQADGTGVECDILAGINWALENECRVLSMSLGAKAPRDDDYDRIARIAQEKNCLLIAAAGNDSNRPDELVPVEKPANARAILAVGAIDRRQGIASFSNAGIVADGGSIDLVGPGVSVRSSKRVTFGSYGIADGTSMATPHVAGIAALLMEADPAAKAGDISDRLTLIARSVGLAAEDGGHGLVQAPVP